jgi:hypothetical protein
MVDNVVITAGTGTTVAADEVNDATLGLVKVQYVKIMDGTLDGTTKAAVGAAGIKVDGSGVTQPISGTIAVTQSGTWTVQPGNTPNTVAWKVDGSAVTQPVSLAAETTKVIGVTRSADGTGNLLTSTAGALDINVKSGGNNNGRATPANSAPVVAASQTYETVAASQTGQVLGGSGATGDYIDGVLVIPATTSPGNVILIDNATSITIFTGGATSVTNLVPFYIPLGMISASGAWKLTTGANVSAIGIGNFT